ncbi:MAG: VOC family protein [Actinomycetota bacterium]
MSMEPAPAAPPFELDPARDIRNLHGAPGWFELVTGDPAEAARFLTGAFGWEFRTIDVAGSEYFVTLVRGHEVGGLRVPMTGEPDGPRWQTYVTVDDVEAFARHAQSTGGEVAVPPMELGEVGKMTAIAHPKAGQLLAFEYARPFE